MAIQYNETPYLDGDTRGWVVEGGGRLDPSGHTQGARWHAAPGQNRKLSRILSAQSIDQAIPQNTMMTLEGIGVKRNWGFSAAPNNLYFGNADGVGTYL
ncbi:MAG: hypothetical protein ACRDQA_03500, partial [Nocardioidaceae bacterium]